MILLWYVVFWLLISIFVFLSGFMLFESVVNDYSKFFIFFNTFLFCAYFYYLIDSIKDYAIMIRRKRIQQELDVERSFRKLGGD